MSSSQPFQASSPLSAGEPRRKKSKFTYRQLSQLAVSATTCPLRVIAHVDLDAFYAQCEMVRLGVKEYQPLAVQQWQGLIAINYPARAFKLARHVSPTEAKKLCPDIILQHVATWREGDEKWAYHDDAASNIATHKVSLDPYRLESRKILKCIKDTLPESLQKVEKASIDEVFMDLSAQIHTELLERYEELRGPAPYDDPLEFLPLPPTTVLDWQADALVDLDVNETEEDDPDWDDVAMLIGSEIVRKVRAAVRNNLKYTCSAGVAQNKMLAKLGSAHRKPNQQTVIRNRAIQQFLSDFKFTKIRGLGGKLGDSMTEVFNTDTLRDLLPVPIEQLKQKLGDDTGTWVHEIIRGKDSSEVNSRTQIKSMLSAKSFRPSINTPEQANRWLRIFAADIYSRLVEEGVLENKRRPKTINLHHRQGGQTKSRQGPIPSGKKIDEVAIFELAKNMLGQIILEGRVWPCANLSLSVGGFEDGISGNMGIGAFLVKGDEAKALQADVRESSVGDSGSERPDKRRRTDTSSGIKRFFAKTDSTGEHDDDFGSHNVAGLIPSADAEEADQRAATSLPAHQEATKAYDKSPFSTSTSALHQQHVTDYLCNRCEEAFVTADDLQNHQDWHFAKDLHDEDRGRPGQPSKLSTAAASKKQSGNVSKKKAGRGRPEKGQSKLAFG
ncbi:DNA-directed DNA polymerase eta rad30 [Cadophora gregata]|uniref:DNA-directed DNA polymerase eta rad30 n=1 Tax=Cadophora gregata TaxID=51156 RepID=UPI0026DCE1A0|nr:DNA-directed DNA polymerase eta rad30 [Cadophora gregata]KAK0105752.1 DNA-directed DNA polymerase eta rad30 [Cadophora gregata]